MKLLGLFLITISLSQCGSSKFDDNPPFKVSKATVTNWVGGVEGASGTNVFVYVDKILKIEFDKIYYNNASTKIQIKKDANGTPIIAGYFDASTTNKPKDIVLNASSEKEFGNELPSEVKKFPFELKHNEAVISYKKGAKTLYYKVKNIQKITQKKFY